MYIRGMIFQCDSWREESGQRLTPTIWPHRFLDMHTQHILGKVKGRPENDSLSSLQLLCLDVYHKSASCVCQLMLQPSYNKILPRRQTKATYAGAKSWAYRLYTQQEWNCSNNITFRGKKIVINNNIPKLEFLLHRLWLSSLVNVLICYVSFRWSMVLYNALSTARKYFHAQYNFLAFKHFYIVYQAK